MGNVVLEAMACGQAVVAPRAGGIPTLIAEGETGLLYAPRDLADAVRATGRVLNNRAPPASGPQCSPGGRDLGLATFH